MRTPALADLPLRGKGLVMVAIPVVALLVATAVLLLVQSRQEQAELWVRHTFEVRSDVQSLHILMIEADAGVRGYLLARNQELLAPYRDAVREVPRLLLHLDALVGDNAAQSARTRRLRQIAHSELEGFAELLRTFGEAADPAGLRAAMVRSGRSIEEARAELAAMQAEEERLLTQRIQEAEAARRHMYRWIVGGTLLAVLGAILIPLLIGTAIVRRIAAVQRNAELLAERLPLALEPSGKDEVGKLSDAVIRADRLLAERERTLRETEQFLQHLIATSPTVIFRQDPADMAITYVSPNSERLLGYSPQEIMETPHFWMEHTHPEDRDRVLEEDRQAFAQHLSYVESEYRMRHKDGGYRWMRSFVKLEYDADGTPRSILGHRLDITARKRAEADLVERQVTLDAANRELEAFSYSVSHDLRAPLRSVDGFSRILLEEYSAQLDPDAQDYLKRVRASSRHMATLIDDLLKLSRVTRAQMSREPVDLSRLAEAVGEDLRNAEPRRQVELVIEPGVTAVGDPGLLRVVLQNLLGNAWKFTSCHPTARIEFGVSQTDGGAVYFVRDNGAGFDTAYSRKLFGAFQRLHSGSEFPGTGIGLATVQRIVHRHGGKIWGHGAVNQGATFCFTLRPGVDGAEHLQAEA